MVDTTMSSSASASGIAWRVAHVIRCIEKACAWLCIWFTLLTRLLSLLMPMILIVHCPGLFRCSQQLLLRVFTLLLLLALQKVYGFL